MTLQTHSTVIKIQLKSKIQRVRDLSQGKIEWTEGMLYPVLHRLERDRLVSSAWKQSEQGRERKYYRLTHKGRQELHVEHEQWQAAHETLAKLWATIPILT